MSVCCNTKKDWHKSGPCHRLEEYIECTVCQGGDGSKVEWQMWYCQP